ncbi:alpha/beta fold hydrolase [Streptomyces luteolifulvus]|uniref:alpha/beta fold hydrolase n=1 Tax=Streptomyces luteolifulvus TaxID=2615112 RepID=UPI001CD9276C|nr:alpha/beta fold hydrolase [Streptomyces luteolifulvus]
MTTLALPALAQPEQGNHRTPASGIDWHACADTDFQHMQCGSIRVPVDWSHPRAGSLTLTLVRRPADDQEHRQGTLLVNNGAGGSSIEQLRLGLRMQLPSFAGAMTQRFDLVAVDPRGVGHSTPILCGEPLKPAGVSHFPRNQAAYDTLVAHNRAFADDCRRRNGRLTAHVDLTSTARDFEAVRKGLGERQLNWYGIHYSTLLGRTYAQLYPGRLRTKVLDTALDDTGAPRSRIIEEAATAETAFDRFTAWCAIQAMAAQLPGSVVLAREGDDYSMFLLSRCVRDATNRYLTTRTLPRSGTTCTD